MSLLDGYLEGLTFLNGYLEGLAFRTSTPSFDVGAELTLFVTDYDETDDVAVARVGESRLAIPDATADAVGNRARITVTEFDDTVYRGQAELHETLDGGAFD